MSLSHGSQAMVGKGHQAAHVTVGISYSPLVILDSSVCGSWLHAGTPSVNPGLMPRELSGTPAVVHGYELGVRFEVSEALCQVCLALLFLARDFSGFGYHVYKMRTTNHSWRD